MKKGEIVGLVRMIMLVSSIIIGIGAAPILLRPDIAALAQTTNSVTKPTTTTTVNTFSMNGEISSLVLGMSPKTKTVDMATVQKFILSGDWSMSVNKGKLESFAANFYTGPANGGISNHTHQISNFRVENNNNNIPIIIQLSPTKSVSISGISDVGTNGKKAWNNVHTTIVISNGRTISISLADKDTQAHFMGQQIYGIVKRLNI
jgi:hypothetical protein